MKKFVSAWLICLLLSLTLVPCAGASLDSSTITSREEIDGTVLLADYPADEFSSSFIGTLNGGYTEVYSYEDVGVMVHNQRNTIFGGYFDEIIFLNNNYGPIHSAEMIEIDALDGSYLTVRMRYEGKSDGTGIIDEWIADVVKVYAGEYNFMFAVVRDADGKNYAKKVDALVDSLKLSENAAGFSASDDDEENFFAPQD